MSPLSGVGCIPGETMRLCPQQPAKLQVVA
jgi:hypothetical protein